MPELPQIQPNSGVAPAGVVPVSPGNTFNHVNEASQTIQDQAEHIFKQAQVVDRYTQFHQANADYIVGSANIVDNANSISDPALRVKAIQDSTQALRDSILKDYPDAGPELASNLDVKVSEDYHRAVLSAKALAHDNAVGNLAALAKSTASAFASAKDPKDAAVIQKDYSDTVDAYVAHGVIDQGDGAKYKATMLYESKKAANLKLAYKDPLAYLKLSPEQTGLTMEDFFATRFQAYGEDKRQNETAERQYQGIVNQANQAILNGTVTDAQVEAGFEAGIVTERMYAFHFHHAPSNIAVANHILNDLDNAIIPDKLSLDNYMQENVYNRLDLRPPDMKRINAKYASLSSILNTENGTIQRNISIETQQKLKAMNPGLWMLTGVNPPEKQEMSGDFKAMNNEVVHAKTVSEAQAAADKYIKKWESRPGFGGTTSGTAGTVAPSSGTGVAPWMGATPTSMRTPSPEDFLSKPIPRD